MSQNQWQRLADALLEEDRAGCLYTEDSGLVRALRRLAAEDAEREGHSSGTDTGAMSGGGADRPQSDGGSTPPGANRLPPLDHGLADECMRAYYDAWLPIGHSMRDGLTASLTHYRERVEKPLRDALDASLEQVGDLIAQRDDVLAEANRLRGELAKARAEADRYESDRDMHLATLEAVADALGTGERGKNLVAVARAAQRAASVADLRPLAPPVSLGRRWVGRDSEGAVSLVVARRREEVGPIWDEAVEVDLVPVEEKP